MRALDYVAGKIYYRPEEPIILNMGDASTEESPSAARPRAVKTFEAKVCVFYENHVRRLVESSPKWIRGCIEPRFATYQIKAFLLEVTAGSNAILEDSVGRGLQGLHSAKIRTTYFSSFVNDEVKPILARMSSAQRSRLYGELQKKMSDNDSDNTIKKYCELMQRAIIECEVHTRKAELDSAYSTVLAMPAKKKTEFDAAMKVIGDIENDIFKNFVQDRQDADACANLRNWIGLAAVPSRKQLARMARGMVDVTMKLHLLENIQRHQELFPEKQVFAQLYDCADDKELTFFGAVETTQKFSRNLKLELGSRNGRASVANSVIAPAQTRGRIVIQQGRVATVEWRNEKIKSLEAWDRQLFATSDETTKKMSKKQLFREWILQVELLLADFEHVAVGVLKDNEHTGSFNVARVRQFREDMINACGISGEKKSPAVILGNVWNIYASAYGASAENATQAEKNFIEISRNLFGTFCEQIKCQPAV